MTQHKIGEEVYAILVPTNNPQEGTEWFGSQHESLQVSRMKYPAGKSFRTHWHILNPRTIKRTQEAFVVVRGRIAVDVYDNGRVPKMIGTLEAGPGEAVFVYRGGHGVRVLEDFIGYELKCGSFSYVSEDKEFQDV
jgi:hypothetical protein